MFYAFVPANETLAFLATLGVASVMFIVISAAFLAVLGVVGVVRLLAVGGRTVGRGLRSLTGRIVLPPVTGIRPSPGKVR